MMTRLSPFLPLRLLILGLAVSGVALAQSNTEKTGLQTEAATPLPKGHLIIHGGGRLTKDVVKRFAELGGGKDGHLVIVPTSGEGKISMDPKTASGWLKSLGFGKISILHTRSPKEADTREFVEPLKDATAIWFSGGRQWRTMDVYHGTRTADAFRGVFQRGGVIAGSSAGATVQGSYLVRGSPEGNHVMMAKGHEAGFGFLDNVAIDQHAIKRGRLDDMIEVVQRFPKILGIAIDEGTALEVHGGIAKVMGESKVAFYDRAKWNDGGKKYQLLGSGERYDIANRLKLAKP
ncbi:MAG: cyanophycinase [Verrucomicrobiales bacterium]